MKASNAAMISSRFSTACGFSILAITGRVSPSSAMTSRTRVTSEALRTKDSAIRSKLLRRAKRKSSSSFSESAGTLTATPGRLMPLLPWRSASRPIVLPMAFAAARVSARRRACSSWEPWLMLKRATSRPGCDRRSTPAWSAERGRRPDPGPARRDRPVGRRDCAAPADERGQGRAGLPQPTPGSSWPAAATSRLVSPRRWTRSARGWASPESPHAERPAGGDPAARPTDSVRVASARG